MNNNNKIIFIIIINYKASFKKERGREREKYAFMTINS